MKLEYIRVERNTRLKESDTQKLIIDDTGTDFQKKLLAKRRQHLRDIPAIVRPIILSMSDASQLEAYTPNWEPA
jgi:mevalonate kinase